MRSSGWILAGSWCTDTSRTTHATHATQYFALAARKTKAPADIRQNVSQTFQGFNNVTNCLPGFHDYGQPTAGPLPAPAESPSSLAWTILQVQWGQVNRCQERDRKLCQAARLLDATESGPEQFRPPASLDVCYDSTRLYFCERYCCYNCGFYC